MNNFKHLPKGFSLIELCIAMAVLAILASSIVPIGIRSIEIKAAEKTALEMAMIQQASRNFYIDHHAWPTNIATLQTQGYLNSSWVAKNPWSNPYQTSNTNLSLTVNTDMPTQWIRLVASHLPAAVINNANISSTISSLETSSELQTGLIVAWSGAIADIPTGWALCDGHNGTPDLRDKFIVGAREDVGGIAHTRMMGSLQISGGKISHNHGEQTGGHQLSIEEMPSHSHSYNADDGGARVTSSLLGRGGNAIGKGHTDTLGGNQPHSHTITDEYNVPPFYALAFIMKL